MNIFLFLLGLCIGLALLELRDFLQRKRSEKEYQDYLARCCKSCGGLLEPGETCECSAFTEKERK
jgi:hypothetical protein